MPTRILPILIIFQFSLCASASELTYMQAHMKATKLASEDKFDEARALVAGKGRLCNAINKNDFCYGGYVEDAETKITKAITEAETCVIAIRNVEKEHSDRSSAEAALERMAEDCNKFGLPQAYESRVANAEKSLNNKLKSLSFARKTAAGTDNPLASQQNACRENMKWGYFKNNQSMIPKNKDLFGKFASFEKCEEARLTDNSATGHSCRERNIGSAAIGTIFKLDYMIETSEGSYDKVTVNFSSTDACKSARSEGLGVKADDESGRIIQVNKAGSENKPKFIGECHKEKITVCDQFGSEIRSPAFAK